MSRFSVSAVLVGLLASAGLAQAPVVPGSETMDRMLDRVQVMQGREFRSITIYPLVLKEGVERSESLGVVTLADAADKVTFRDPKWPARRWNVEVTSRAERPVLLLGGTLLVGGRLDRMIPEDLLIPAGSTVEIGTIPAEYPRDLRKGKDASDALNVSRFLAPVYLRKLALFDPEAILVPRFVSHFLGFRQDGDLRRSLQAVSESPALEREIRAYLDAFANLPGQYEKRVVGWVSVVGGRLHGIELFGTNALASAYFPAILRSYAFPTVALAIRAESLDLKMPEPGDAEDPERFRPEVDGFLKTIRGSERRCGIKPEGTLGASCLLRKGDAWGEAMALDDALVHAGAAADLPFQDRLYGRSLPPPPGETDDPSLGELERRGEGDLPGRRLTEFEKRLLERMRERRGR